MYEPSPCIDCPICKFACAEKVSEVACEITGVELPFT